MFNYEEEIMQIFEAENRTKQKITLPAIDATLKTEAKKHGKKSLNYEVIRELRAKNFNDIAIYVGMALAQTKLLPHWSLDDIVGELESQSHIDKKYAKHLKGKAKGSTVQQKKIAMEIWKNIIENEGGRKIKLSDKQGKEVEVKTDEIVDQIKDKNIALAHELVGTRQKIEKAILNALGLFAKIASIEPSYKFDANKYYSFDPDKKPTTTQYINALIGRGIAYSGSPNPIPQEIMRLITDFEFSAETEQFLRDISDTLNKVNKNILWPEADFKIDSYEKLKKYFKGLSSPAESKRGEQIIKGYKKKEKEIEKQTYGIDDNELAKIIERAVNKIENMSSTIDQDKFYQAVTGLSKNIIAENPGVVDFIIKNENLQNIENEIDRQEAVEDEIAAMIARQHRARKSHLGRKFDIWKD